MTAGVRATPPIPVLVLDDAPPDAARLAALVAAPGQADTLVVFFGLPPLDFGHPLVLHADDRPAQAAGGACACCAAPRTLAQALSDATWRFSAGGQRRFSRVLVVAATPNDAASAAYQLAASERLGRHYGLAGTVSLDGAAAALAASSQAEPAHG